MANSQRIREQVAHTLDDDTADYDLDAIVTALIQRYDLLDVPAEVVLDRVPPEEYWEIVAAHDLRLLPPIQRARRAAELIEEHRTLVGHYATMRAQAVLEAQATMRASEVAAELGISPSAVTKMTKTATTRTKEVQG